jgi:PD-(D/E)XK nuclease superfamily protein
MVKRGLRIKNHKRRGEWAELEFMSRATGMGFGVSRPWGESARYDVGVEYGGRYMRVQVKIDDLQDRQRVCLQHAAGQRSPALYREAD